MKRDKPVNEIFSHYSLFAWEECVFCHKEFRRERGWRMTAWNSWLFSCGTCSLTKENFDRQWEDKKKSSRPPMER